MAIKLEIALWQGVRHRDCSIELPASRLGMPERFCFKAVKLVGKGYERSRQVPGQTDSSCLGTPEEPASQCLA
jgi:hypothetical protein